MLRSIFSSKYVLAYICSILFALSSCSSTDQSEFDDPMEVIHYDHSEDEDEESQVIDDYSQYHDDGSEDEELGHSEVTSDEAVNEAMYDSTDAPNYQDGSHDIAAGLDALSIPQNPEALSDSEPQLPDYSDSGSIDALASDSMNQGSFSNSYASTSPSIGGDSSHGEYIVQPGDTLSVISLRIFGTSRRWRELADINGVSEPTRIMPGDLIRYPLTQRSEEFQSLYTSLPTETVTVQAGDTLSAIADRVMGRPAYWRCIWRLNAETIPDPHRIEIGQVLHYVDPSRLNAAMSEKGWSVYGH